MNARRFAAATGAQLRMTVRNRVGLFWALLFPIILMTLLGLLFGGSGGGTLAVVDHAGTPASGRVVAALERTDAVAVERRDDEAAARDDVRDGDVEGLLVLSPAPAGVRADLLYAGSAAASAGVVRAAVAGAAGQVSLREAGAPPAVAVRERPVESTSLDYVDFLMPGVIAIAIMVSSVFGVSTVLVDWRRRGILRRLRVTPMPLLEFLLSRIVASLAVTVLQLVVLLAFGRLAFGIDVAGTAWAAVPVALAGALCFLAFGFLIGSLVSTPETADAVANVFTTPMMFLSGTFVPVAVLPGALEAVARVLPLTYLADGLRDTTVRGLALGHVGGDLAVLAGTTLVLAGASVRLFRWDPEGR